MGNCPIGEEYDAGLCYKSCRAGYKGVGPVCYGTCPSEFKDIGLFCEKGPPYGRGAGHTTKNKCLNSGDRGASTNGCEKNGALWYPICDPGYSNFACCICSPNCPAGFKDTGIGCAKPSYGRGAGTIPSIFSRETILIIIAVIVIIIVVIIAFAFSRTKRKEQPQFNANLFMGEGYYTAQ